MKLINVLLATSLVALSATSASAAYKEIQCSTDAIFSANSCNQCFEGGAKGEGANLGLLSDEWVNTSDVDKMLYKEEQENPRMINLDTTSVSWKEVPGSAGFWEYTPEFNALYNTGEEGYILRKGQKVTWLKSKLGYAYQLEKNKAAQGRNIGLLVYPISIHNISAGGDVTADTIEHRECVLFKSGAPEVKDELHTGTKPTAKASTLPKTGPEHYILLLLVAMIAGFGFMKLRKNG